MQTRVMDARPSGLLVPSGTDSIKRYTPELEIAPGFGPTDYALRRGRGRRKGLPWHRLPIIAGGAAKVYVAYNGTRPTTAALAVVATGTTIKTLMQLASPSTTSIRAVEWGIMFDAVNAAPVKCELIDTAAINATVTTYASTDVMAFNAPNDEATRLTLGTAASGFTASAEGTITAARLGDYQFVAQQYLKQFPLGREFEMAVSRFMRVRVTAAVTSGAVCYVVWEE